jgi:hypothetical protein
MKTHLSNGVQERDVDQLLSDFFRRELPNPWPEAKFPEPSIAAPRRRGLRRFPRLALAASIAFLVAGYLLLAGLFPPDRGARLIQDPSGTIGKGLRPVQPQRVPTPRGGEALLWEETIPGDRPTIIINVQELPKANQR